MTKKTNIILAIGTFSILLLGVVGYFGVNYLMDKNFQENTIQCSNDTEKRREYLKYNKTSIDENFYSRKLKTCIIKWFTSNYDQGVMINASLIIKELYTWRLLGSFSLCSTKDECNLVLNYNLGKITELTWIEKDELRNICSTEDKTNTLNKYCSLVKDWDWRKKGESLKNSYR